MKVKVISRNPDDYQRETKYDIFKAPRTYDIASDPFRHQIEYTRALNAAKLERVFAKPFIASFDGHNEAVHVLQKHPNRIATILSGARDGQVKVWHLTTRKCLATLQAHNGPLNGLSVDGSNGGLFITVGQDKQIKVWNMPDCSTGDCQTMIEEEPCHSICLNEVPHSVSHFYNKSDFATSGETVEVWKLYRDSPIRRYQLGPNSLHHISCNPVEDTIMAACSMDRTIYVLDSRQKVPLTKVVLKHRSNAISWHPLEAYTFTCANEDYNLYSFDLRYLDSARNVHHGHTAAVIDVDYAPTGQEFVTGSYDRSIRIFQARDSRSRELYHAPRMQNVLSVLWSLDNKYVLSGSDEMNIRLWKSNASEKLGPLRPRERKSFEYGQQLKKTYLNHPEIHKILKHRQVPKSIYSSAREHQIIRMAERRKEQNRRMNTKNPGQYVPERAKPIVSHGFEEEKAGGATN